MHFAKSWFIPQVRNSFESEEAMVDALVAAGVGEDADSLHVLNALSVFIGLLKVHDDEGCNALTRKVQRGTWDMMLRAMASAADVGQALMVLENVVEVFDLPMNIELRLVDNLLFVNISVKDKRSDQSYIYDMGVCRLLFAALCWYAGRQLDAAQIVIPKDFFGHANRNSDGSLIEPFKAKSFSLVAGDGVGFAIERAHLDIPPAIATTRNALVETFKWFGLLDTSFEAKMLHNAMKPGRKGRSVTKNVNRSRPAQYGLDRVAASGLPQLRTADYLDDQNKVNLLRSKILLTTTDKSISEIAYQLGFGRDAYFRRCFAGEFGLAPSDYRKQSLNSNFVGSNHIMDSILGVLLNS